MYFPVMATFANNKHLSPMIKAFWHRCLRTSEGSQVNHTVDIVLLMHLVLYLILAYASIHSFIQLAKSNAPANTGFI